MATFGRVEGRSMQAAADLRSVQYHVLRQSAAGETNISSNPGGSARDVIGVLQTKPNSGQAANVGYFGETKVVVGGACTRGALLAPNGSGRVIDAASGDFVVGMGLEAATTDGERIRMLLRQPAVQLPTSLNT